MTQETVAERPLSRLRITESPRFPSSLRLAGDWGDALRRSCDQWTLKVDEDVLLQGFRKRPGPRPFSGEHIGKWALGALDMNRCLSDERLDAKIRRVVEEWVTCQEDDGYLGTYEQKDRWCGGIPHPTPFFFWPAPRPLPNSWDLWVHKYAILALLEYHGYTQWAPALVAARCAADLVIREFGPDSPRDLNRTDEHQGLASGSILEPMVLLYRRTGDERYLEFARRIVTEFWERDDPDGPRVMPILRRRGAIHRIGRGKAYEMMSCFVGLVEYGRATGDAEILECVRDARDRIADMMRYPTGGMSHSEWFTFPGELSERANIETCVAFTWIQLNLRLFEATGEERALNLAEETAWNQLLPSLCPDGSTWTYHLPVTGPKRFARRGGQEGDEGGALTCCHTNGQRGLALFPKYYYTDDADGALCVNFYGASTAEIELSGVGTVRVEQHTAYPRDGAVELRLTPERGGSYTVRLRRPDWASTMRVDGQPVAESDSRHTLRCDGPCTIRIELPMKPRLRVLGHEARGRFAAAYGPLMLAVDKAPDGWDLDAVALDLHPERFSDTVQVTQSDGWPEVEAPAVRLPGRAVAETSDMAEAPRATVRLKPVLKCGLEGNPCLTRDLGFQEISIHEPDSRGRLPEYRVMVPCYPTAESNGAR